MRYGFEGLKQSLRFSNGSGGEDLYQIVIGKLLGHGPISNTYGAKVYKLEPLEAAVETPAAEAAVETPVAEAAVETPATEQTTRPTLKRELVLSGVVEFLHMKLNNNEPKRQAFRMLGNVKNGLNPIQKVLPKNFPYRLRVETRDKGPDGKNIGYAYTLLCSPDPDQCIGFSEYVAKLAANPDPLSAINDALTTLREMILPAIKYIHARGFVHGQISSDSFRFEYDGSKITRCFIVDLDCLVHAPDGKLEKTIGHESSAPELRRKIVYTAAADIYGLGKIFQALIPVERLAQVEHLGQLEAHWYRFVLLHMQWKAPEARPLFDTLEQVSFYLRRFLNAAVDTDNIVSIKDDYHMSVSCVFNKYPNFHDKVAVPLISRGASDELLCYYLLDRTGSIHANFLSNHLGNLSLADLLLDDSTLKLPEDKQGLVSSIIKLLDKKCNHYQYTLLRPVWRFIKDNNAQEAKSDTLFGRLIARLRLIRLDFDMADFLVEQFNMKDRPLYFLDVADKLALLNSTVVTRFFCFVDKSSPKPSAVRNSATTATTRGESSAAAGDARPPARSQATAGDARPTVESQVTAGGTGRLFSVNRWLRRGSSVRPADGVKSPADVPEKR